MNVVKDRQQSRNGNRLSYELSGHKNFNIMKPQDSMLIKENILGSLTLN